MPRRYLASGIQLFAVLQDVEVEQQILIANAIGLGRLVGIQVFPIEFHKTVGKSWLAHATNAASRISLHPKDSKPSQRSIKTKSEALL